MRVQVRFKKIIGVTAELEKEKKIIQLSGKLDRKNAVSGWRQQPYPADNE